MTTPTDWRALCAELLDELDFQSSCHSAVDLKARARAALAQPAIEPPAPVDLSHLSDEQFNALAPQGYHGVGDCLPVPEGPIPESELADMWNQQADSFNQWESLDSGEQLEWAQARAIARCVRPAIKPVSVAERLPGPEHCDAEGQSWWYHPETMSCVACWCYSRGNGTEKHWLPHHALPVPQQDGNQ